MSRLRSQPALIGCAVALALLAACSRSNDAPDETPAAENVAVPLPEPAEPPPPRIVAPEARTPEPDRNVSEALPAEEPPSPDAQMLEDADATGLTARTAKPDGVPDPTADPVGGAPSNGFDPGGGR